jgi:hypothetical protein
MDLGRWVFASSSSLQVSNGLVDFNKEYLAYCEGSEGLDHCYPCAAHGSFPGNKKVIPPCEGTGEFSSIHPTSNDE